MKRLLITKALSCNHVKGGFTESFHNVDIEKLHFEFHDVNIQE